MFKFQFMTAAHSCLVMVGKEHTLWTAQRLQFGECKTFVSFGRAKIEIFGFEAVVWIEENKITAFECRARTL